MDTPQRYPRRGHFDTYCAYLQDKHRYRTSLVQLADALPQLLELLPPRPPIGTGLGWPLGVRAVTAGDALHAIQDAEADGYWAPRSGNAEAPAEPNPTTYAPIELSSVRRGDVPPPPVASSPR